MHRPTADEDDRLLAEESPFYARRGRIRGVLVMLNARLSRRLDPIPFLAPLPGRSKQWDGQQLRGHVNELDAETRQRVVAYLCGGYQFNHWLGGSEDQIGGVFSTASGMSILSDGRFYWRKDAIDYVLTYGIGLPAGVLSHMERSGWVCAKLAPWVRWATHWRLHRYGFMGRPSSGTVFYPESAT